MIQEARRGCFVLFFGGGFSLVCPNIVSKTGLEIIHEKHTRPACTEAATQVDNNKKSWRVGGK